MLYLLLRGEQGREIDNVIRAFGWSVIAISCSAVAPIWFTLLASSSALTCVGLAFVLSVNNSRSLSPGGEGP